MQALIEKGADVNKHGGDYGSALQAAAWFGDADNVKLLLDHGAIVNTEPLGIYGNPLQAACETGDEDTIRGYRCIILPKCMNQRSQTNLWDDIQATSLQSVFKEAA